MDNNRISLSAIGAAPTVEPIYLQIGEATIEVRPRISYEEILNMMQWCIDMVVGEKPFMSAPLLRIVKDFAILNAYTNLDLGVNHEFEDVESVYAEYDIVHAFGVMENVLPKLDAKQIAFFEKTVNETMKSIIDYRNSAKGIIDTIAADAGQEASILGRALELMENDESRQKISAILEAGKATQG